MNLVESMVGNKSWFRMINVKQLIWFIGFAIIFQLANLPYAITTGFVRTIQPVESIIIFIIWIVPLYLLRDKK